MSFYTFLCFFFALGILNQISSVVIFVVPSVVKKSSKNIETRFASKVGILKSDNWYYFYGLAFKWNLFRDILKTSKTFTMELIDKYVAIRFLFSWRNFLSFVIFFCSQKWIFVVVFFTIFFSVNSCLLQFNTISQITDTKVRGKVSFFGSVQG